MINLVFFFIIHLASCGRIIQTNTGLVSGIEVNGKNVDAFLGIPFAEPPVGNLRFARPVPKTPWKETFNATKLPSACVQFSSRNISMNEDCLYLNLWVPKNGSDLKKVMVFIYGGAFLIGSSSMDLYNGATLSDYGGVIVASMNYRVGTLGFFCGFIDEAAGSMGMYDQLLALEWIRGNVRHFGGDPDNILIFGESAGAFSVSFHMISPLSKNLFKRAIMQSGSSISPMYSEDNKALRTGSKLVSMRLGCASNNEELEKNPEGVVKCMKNLPPEKFAEVDLILVKKFVTGEFLMIPRVGDEFLPHSPIYVYRKGEFKNTEVLLGVNSNEGALFVLLQLRFLYNDTLGNMFNAEAFNKTSAEEVVKFHTRNEKSNKIVQKYFKRVEEDPNYTYLNAASDIIGDAMITCGTVFQADFQSLEEHPAYFYHFDYRSTSSPYPEWVGVTHLDELPYVFGNPQFQNFTEYEKKLSKSMMDMWVSFAKTGDPNIPGRLIWPKYTYNRPKHLHISDEFKVRERPDNYRCEAWRKYFGSTINDNLIQNLKKYFHDKILSKIHTSHIGHIFKNPGK